MKRLIVNADDFGLTSGINRAVIECYLGGSVTSTTLMVNGQAAVEAALEAADNPGLGVGLHLNLTAGPPTAAAGKVRSLLGPDGNFPGMRQALWRLTTGRAKAHELENEIIAQVERLRSLGVRPTHIDSHHHLHAHPRLRSLIKRTCPRLGITRMRGYHLPVKSAKALAVATAARLPAPGNAMQTPAAFAGIEVMGSTNMTAELERRLAGDGDALEFMCHPGYADEALARLSSYNQPRQTELETLLSEAFAAAIVRSGAQPVSFGAL